jgi:uncharacterized protein
MSNASLSYVNLNEEPTMKILILISLTINLPLNIGSYTAKGIPYKLGSVDNTPTHVTLPTSQDEDPDSIDETGLTPLMQAVQDKNPSRVLALIAGGANVDIKNSYGWTALTYAITSKQPNIVKALLERRPDINTKDERGMSALMWASLVGNKEIVKLLLDAGADVNAEANNGATALSFATARGHKNAARLLKEAGGVGPQVDKARLPKWLTPIDQVPRITNWARPNVTAEARKHGIQGVVYLRVLFGTDGKVKKVKVTRGLPFGLTEEAVKTASKLKAKPAMNKGQVIEYWAPVQVEFNVQGSPF